MNQIISDSESAVKEINMVPRWRVAGEAVFNRLIRECLSGEETYELKPKG